MKFSLLAVICLFALSLPLQAQVRVTDEKVEEVIKQFDPKMIEVTQVRAMPKWKALGLTREMKEKMDYYVLRVKYKTSELNKTMLIDMNLVPIEYDVAHLPKEYN